MSSSVGKVNDTVQNLQRLIANSLGSLKAEINSIVDISTVTSNGAQQQSASTQEQSAVMQELSANTQDIMMMVNELQSSVKVFKVKKQPTI